jgi:hypothetical protein
MAIVLLVLLLALILGGLGFAIHVLWWIALVVLVLWLLGFAVRVGEGSSRRRWYRWLPASPYRRQCYQLPAAVLPATVMHQISEGRALVRPRR